MCMQNDLNHCQSPLLHVDVLTHLEHFTQLDPGPQDVGTP